MPAAFCASEVFVDAAVISSDFGDLMLGAALSAFDFAAMLCFQKSEWNGETGWCFISCEERMVLGRSLELSGVLPVFMVNSGSSLCVSPSGLMAWMSGAHLVAEMGGFGFGDTCCSVVRVLRPRWVDAAIVRGGAWDAAWLQPKQEQRL